MPVSELRTRYRTPVACVLVVVAVGGFVTLETIEAAINYAIAAGLMVAVWWFAD